MFLNQDNEPLLLPMASLEIISKSLSILCHGIIKLNNYYYIKVI